MKLYPHKIIEGMDNVLARASSWRDQGEEYWNDVYHDVPFADRFHFIASAQRLVRCATVYDFGEVTPEFVHFEFASMLLQQGVFDDYPPTLVLRDRDDQAYYFVAERGIIMVTTFKDVKEGLISPVMSFVHKECVWDEEVNDIRVAGVCKNYFSEKAMRQLYGERSHKDIHAGIFAGVVSCLSMLGCKETEVMTVEAPRKLNATRIKRRREPIREHKVIKINLKQTTTERGPLDGSRASPKPHWRRPHLRHLADGRVTPIPPMWINWHEAAGTPAPDKKQYEVVP